MTLTAAEIRRQFIDFFVQKHGHAFVASSPVVPHDDPTLLFTNAGMNQFKPIFLGLAAPKPSRVANSQKCIRAGGKHNDLDDVGHDTYHHTFFEMLGNWSFGDYFKREAIRWAWELLTQVWNVDKSRLHATYFQGDPSEGLEPDTEAAQLWRTETDIDPTHIHPGNKKDNFWEMGDTGPCGPCSEIHIDLTPDRSGTQLVNKGDARVMEIWNLVFIQFNRGADGRLTPLPAKHVDTGMGFERITSVLQGKRSNYDTDVFEPIFAAIQRVTGAPAYSGLLEGSAEATKRGSDAVMKDVAYRVIADHLRCLTFALTDGAVPSNEGRGYVLRRILRRAVRYGRQYLGTTKPFLCELAPSVAEAMGQAFGELKTAHGGKNVQRVSTIMREEEEAFGRTLDRGIALFAEAADRARRHHHGRIAGEDAFKMHDTFGFPIDLTELMAQEQGLTVDIGEYERLMEEARERARGKHGEAMSADMASLLQPLGATEFVGYDRLECSGLNVIMIMKADRLGEPADAIRFGERGAIVLDRTPFYAEKGGQVGDRGLILHRDTARFRVETTHEIAGAYVHFGVCEAGEFHVGACPDCIAAVDQSARLSTMRNHTATHVMNWALREVLGDHVDQKGSLVDPDRTRFDFSHTAPLSEAELRRIESLVQAKVRENLPVYADEAPLAEARRIHGLRAVFGEKYPERVRVVSIGAPVGELLGNPGNPGWRQYSVEFCGGTHLSKTGEINAFRLVEETGVAKGVRRVTAITGQRADQAQREAKSLASAVDAAGALDGAALATRVSELAGSVDGSELPVLEKHALRARLDGLMERVRKFQKEQSKQDAAGVIERADALLVSSPRAGSSVIACGSLGEATADQLRSAADSLRAKAGSAAVLLAAEQDGKVVLLAAMTPDVVARGVKAGDVIKEITPLVGGKGGGRPDMAQGGGTNTAGIPDALARATAMIRDKLAS